jgi:ADP-heptose:LPS heptosyltransferase
LDGKLVHAVRSIESRSLAFFFAPGAELDNTWADYFSEFALILSYLYDPDGTFQANVARCSKAQFIPCPHRPDENLNLHATETFLKPLERLAIFSADPVPRLSPHPTGLTPPSDPPNGGANQRTLALHPGSGSDRKNWPERGWRSLLEHLVTLPDWEFLLISGEAEDERAERLVSVIPPGRVSWARSLPLAELATRLATCRAFIGHDSGISHLAAAVGLPGLVLWGETNEYVWRPRSSRFRILRSPRGLNSIEVHRVIDELNDLLSGSE